MTQELRNKLCQIFPSNYCDRGSFLRLARFCDLVDCKVAPYPWIAGLFDKFAVPRENTIEPMLTQAQVAHLIEILCRQNFASAETDEAYFVSLIGDFERIYITG